MQCERCGRSLPEEARFCLNCGHPVTPTRTVAMPGPQQAPRGGNAAPAADPQAPFVTVSSSPVYDSTRYVADSARDPSADRRRGLLTAAAALLVVVLLLAGFAFVLSRRAKERAGVAQVARAPVGEEFQLLPSPRGQTPVIGGPPPKTPDGAARSEGSPVTGAPVPNTPGADVTAVPGPRGEGGPPVVAGPQGQPGGPSLLRGPQGQPGGVPLLRGPLGAGGPSVLQGPRGRPGGPPVVAGPQEQPGGPPVVAGPEGAPNGPPVVATPPPERKPPPPEPQLEDISGYLDRLYRIEQARLQLEAQLLTLVTNTTFQSALRAYTDMGLGDEAQQRAVIQQTARDFEIVARQFEQLNVTFHRTVRPVPNSCRRLHANYSLALTNTPAIVRRLRDALLRMDIGAVNMVQQLGQGLVDRGFRTADAELERLCNERKIPKPFDIGSGARRSGLLGP